MSTTNDAPQPGPGETEVALPYWRLSGFYFFYFALLGGMYPYWPLYLQHLGFTPERIGLLLAVPMITKLIAPNLWAWLGDVTGRRLAILRLGSFLGLFCFLGITINQSFYWLALVIAGYSFFWNAILPQYEVITLGFLKDKPERYSLVRVWGSIGFILAVVGGGYYFEYISIQLFPWVGIGLLACIFISSLLIPQPSVGVREHKRQSLWQVVRQPTVIAFLIAGTLLQMAHGAYYSFFSIYLEEMGFSRSAIGYLWSIGVVAEVFIFMVMHTLLVKVGVRLVLIASLLLAALRWYMIGNGGDWLWVLILAQCLHAFSFGTFHAASIESIRRLFQGGTQAGGQALYGAISFGIGGAGGSYLAGHFWHYGATQIFNVASGLCLLGGLVAWYGFRDARLQR
ncbi:MAG: MFS transporter [Porticoccaceae bacterium]|nr:MFS transporter [Porticoccaceae bacterium]